MFSFGHLAASKPRLLGGGSGLIYLRPQELLNFRMLFTSTELCLVLLAIVLVVE